MTAHEPGLLDAMRKAPSGTMVTIHPAINGTRRCIGNSRAIAVVRARKRATLANRMTIAECLDIRRSGRDVHGRVVERRVGTDPVAMARGKVRGRIAVPRLTGGTGIGVGDEARCRSYTRKDKPGALPIDGIGRTDRHGRR